MMFKVPKIYGCEIPVGGTRDISNEVLLDNGKLKLLYAEEWKKYSFDEFRLFCHFYARYGVPTHEMVEFLKNAINGRSAIEIGAGCGDLGFHLDVPMTDSKVQEEPHVRDAYLEMGQPVIKYPDDVEKLNALAAIKKHAPKVVVASWVTTCSPFETSYGSCPHGVEEEKILGLIETYILIGNKDIHGDKPIMKIPHQEFIFPWIVSRSQNPDNNRIWIWDK